MRQGRAYQIISWGAALAVTLVFVAEWVALYVLHAEGPVVQIDRRTIVSKELVEGLGIAVIAFLVGSVIWRARKRTAPILVRETLQASAALGRKESIKAARHAAKEIALNAGMRECEDAQQWIAHQLIMWGFIGLFVTTSLNSVMNFSAEPLPLLHPVRLLGNVTGIAFMMGLTLAMARRALLAKVRAVSHLQDWTFLISLWGTGATGFAVQWTADMAMQGATGWLYVVHLVFVALILVAAPWSKFIHAAWRPTWVLYRALTLARRT